MGTSKNLGLLGFVLNLVAVCQCLSVHWCQVSVVKANTLYMIALASGPKHPGFQRPFATEAALSC